MSDIELDLITIGRASVDLYGQQIGSRLEDVASFAKSVGGCPANIAIGAARLGLRTALISRVGDEAFGCFIREQLVREGVDVRGVATDPARLTALAILSVRDSDTFPLIFYRENCADAALNEDDIEPAFIRSARAVLVTGTHFARANSASAQRKAIRIAREAGRKVIFDIDYRPNLWGLAGHSAGEARYIASGEVSAHLQPLLGDCDLIVGTEEEIHIAGGEEDTLAALRRIREHSAAAIVVKRGPMGCTVFTGAIPAALDDGIHGAGFPIEVYNVLGAGDGFMSGLLRGYLTGEPWETACTYANACGAIVVSRLLCSPESPTWTELRHFLDHGSSERALRRDPQLAHLHWATTRRPRQAKFSTGRDQTSIAACFSSGRDQTSIAAGFSSGRNQTSIAAQVLALAIDHRAQLEALADRCGAPRVRLRRLKELAVAAAVKAGAGRADIGVLLDGNHGREALFAADRHGLWIGRPVELPASRPLAFETGADLGSHLTEWPVTHTVKCLCFYHPDDPADLKQVQEQRLLALHDAARTAGREYLIEIIAGQHGILGTETVAEVLARLYSIGCRPDWWKLEPQAGPEAWAAIDAVIEREDPLCRGVLLLGLDAPEAELAKAFAAARTARYVKGFAVGRTIFGEPAESWLSGRIDDEALLNEMAARFARLIADWEAGAP